MTAADLRQLALAFPALLLSLSVHEFAHAWTATKLGDSTPKQQGRLTLSPASHIDPIGTLVFPLILTLLHAPAFGWAKPVQFQPANFTRKLSLWQGTALTAVSGPLSNLLLALVSAFAWRWVTQVTGSAQGFAPQFLMIMFQLNVLLAVFNLFPLPPLDGGHLIPPSMHEVREFLTRYSFLIFFGLFFIPIPGIGTLGSIVLYPVFRVLTQLIAGLVGM